MNTDNLSIAYKKLYSVVEKLPETQAIRLMRFLFRILPVEKFDYETEGLKAVLMGPSEEHDLELDSPVILAAGYHEPFILNKALKMGFGAVTAKVSVEPKEGVEEPTIIRTPEGIVNCVGYKNQGMKQLYSDLEHIRKISGSKRIILNMSDYSVENYCKIVEFMDPVVDMFEINSCLNSPECERLDFFQDKHIAKDLFRELRERTRKPIALKLPREKDFPDIYEKTIPVAIDNGITVLNYANGKRVINSRLKSGEGSLSGPIVYRDTLRNVEKLYKEFGEYADIIGTGGIDSPYKAWEVYEKGAKAISYITAFPRDIFLAKGINEFFLKNKRFQNQI